MNSYYSHEAHGTTPETEGVNNGGILDAPVLDVKLVDVLYDDDIPAVDAIVVDITYRDKYGDTVKTYTVTNLSITPTTELLVVDLGIALSDKMRELPGEPNDPACAILVSQRLQQIADEIEKQFLVDR